MSTSKLVAFDLHVLSFLLTFILSQGQTLHNRPFTLYIYQTFKYPPFLNVFYTFKMVALTYSPTDKDQQYHQLI